MEYHLDKMCRICLTEEDDLKSIFFNDDAQNNGISLPSRIMACSSIQVQLGDGLPELICPKCLAQMDVAYEFKEKCLSADATLRKYISLVTPFYSNVLQDSDKFLKEAEAMNSYSSCNDHNNLKSETVHTNIYEFDKDDSISSVDENKTNQDFNDSDSDAPLINQQKQGKRKKKREKIKYTCKNSKGKKSRKSEEEGNTSDVEKRKTKDEKDVECPICNKTFAFMCILKDHMVQHTGAKPYLCSACGKSFAHTASLTNHMKTHYTDKPHKCQHCELSFHRRAHLILHMRTHTGEKPYVCEVCGRDFAQGSYLKEHMRVHSGEKPFVCDICGHGFARKSCLVMHRRVHTGELPYACPECGRAFSQRSQRKRHVKRNHKGSACLRSTGELILKDLDMKNRASIQENAEELLAESSMALSRDNLLLPRDDVTLERGVASTINNSHFRDCTLYPQDTSLSPAMPLPLSLMHRAML